MNFKRCFHLTALHQLVHGSSEQRRSSHHDVPETTEPEATGEHPPEETHDKEKPNLQPPGSSGSSRYASRWRGGGGVSVTLVTQDSQAAVVGGCIRGEEAASSNGGHRDWKKVNIRKCEF
jgi:hypothetical protein